jgi:hypothetical protein
MMTVLMRFRRSANLAVIGLDLGRQRRYQAEKFRGCGLYDA